MLKKISLFWILLVALMLTSGLPLGVIAYRAIESTKTEVEREQKSQLVARTDAHASTIDTQFREFENATMYAAVQARDLMLGGSVGSLSEAEVQERLAKYQRDANNVYGLDNWYDTEYFPVSDNDQISNVFVNQSTELTPELEYTIAATEELNPLFEAIRTSGIGTQWVYLTTKDGMMRLYPWAANSNYDKDWEPQTISFYTAAAAERNPERKPVWTAPYNDFAGAGIMVTNSVPIYNGDELIAVMSHDLRIEDLQNQVLGFQVGKTGYAFLLDNQGNIIAHKDYAPEDTPLGEELSIKLATENPRSKSTVDLMLTNAHGTTTYTDAKDDKWLIVYTTIPATDWHLGMMQPYSEINEPATKIATEVITGFVLMILFVLGMSIWLARRIAQPVRQLSQTAREIETSVDSETAQAIKPNLAQLANLNSAREITNLANVFEQMVLALQKRMAELDSIYAMGQAITAQVDFDQTLRAVLGAVQQVVDFDAAEVTVIRNQKLVVEAWIGRQDFNDTTGREYRIGRGPTGVIAATKAPVFMPTIDETAEDLKRTLGYADLSANEFLAKTTKVVINSFLGIPLTIGDRLVGALSLVHHQAGHFTDDDKRQLNKLAAQASIAIDNAIQVRQRESALKAQIRELRVEIDRTKVSQQVEEITSGDYFQNLRANAAKMRERIYTSGRSGSTSGDDDTAPSKPDESDSNPASE